MKTEYKHLRFMAAKPELTPEFAEEHKVWIVTAPNGVLLGSITYYGPWQEYCLFPTRDTVWSIDCLLDIISFLKQPEVRT